jgi:hypothetical protein
VRFFACRFQESTIRYGPCARTLSVVPAQHFSSALGAANPCSDVNKFALVLGIKPEQDPHGPVVSPFTAALLEVRNAVPDLGAWTGWKLTGALCCAQGIGSQPANAEVIGAVSADLAQSSKQMVWTELANIYIKASWLEHVIQYLGVKSGAFLAGTRRQAHNTTCATRSPTPLGCGDHTWHTP